MPDDQKIIDIAEKIAEIYFSKKSQWQIDHEASDDRQFKAIHDILTEQNVTMGKIKGGNETILENQASSAKSLEPIQKWFERMTWGKQASMRALQVTAMVSGIMLTISGIMVALWQAFKLLIIHASN